MKKIIAIIAMGLAASGVGLSKEAPGAVELPAWNMGAEYELLANDAQDMELMRGPGGQRRPGPIGRPHGPNRPGPIGRPHGPHRPHGPIGRPHGPHRPHGPMGPPRFPR